MLRNMLGPVFDLGLDQFLTQEIWQFWATFGCRKICWNNYFYSVFSKALIFLGSPPPPQKKKSNTICEQNGANW